MVSIEIDQALEQATLILPKKKSKRWLQILLGALVVIVFAAGGVVWQLSLGNKVEVLVLEGSVSRGDVIAGSDLRIVEIDKNQSISFIRASEINEVIGKKARNRIDSGTLLTFRLFSITTPLTSSEAIIGVALDAGQYPVQPLFVGDVVDVITIQANSFNTGVENFAQVIARSVEVFGVTEIGGQTRLLISLRVPRNLTTEIAAAASQGRIWLTLVRQ